MIDGPLVPTKPYIRLRWLLRSGRGEPSWIESGRWVPPGSRALYSRSKQGLRAALAGVDADGPVLVPAYAPGGPVWSALDAGFDVRYYPVDADLSLDPDRVTDRIAELDPAAVLFVNYFGFADPALPELARATRSAGALVVEDCARGLFSETPDGDLLGSRGDLALYCLHKTLPVPNGGLVVSPVVDLPEPTGSRSEWGDLGGQLLRTAVNRLNVSHETLRSSIDPPVDRQPAAVSPSGAEDAPGWASRRVLSHCEPATIRRRRYENYAELYRRLSDVEATEVLTPPPHGGCSPYGVGFLAPTANDRVRLFAALRRRRLPCEILTWPAVYRHGDLAGFDGAATLRRRLLVVPTHQDVPVDATARIASCVEQTLEADQQTIKNCRRPLENSV